ncbi:MAG: TetR/AcrR family transcriptional regulator [Sphingomonadales bacterium]|nr:TetR/AcrR family transcriptional regulator [Sphingomonadales bacterium]
MRDRGATEGRILDAAEHILVRDGIAGFGVNAVARAADVGKPLVYRYFGGRDGLLETLSRRAAEALGELPEARTGSDMVPALIYTGRALAASALARALLAAAHADPAVATTVTPLLDALPTPRGGDDDHAAHYAILLAASCFLVLHRDRQPDWVSVPLSTPRDLARLEAALAELAHSATSERN